MPLSEQLEQINRQLSSHLAGVAEELRRAMLARLRQAQVAALDQLDEIRPEIPTGLLSTELVEDLTARLTPPPPEPAPASPPSPAGSETLLTGLRRIDTARSQAELLEALLESARSHCSRSALFILAEEGCRGWAAAGFGPGLTPLDEHSPDDGPGSPLARLAGAGGALRLDGSACSSLVGALAAETPVDGALVPLVLRDRLAAALYVDRTEGGAEIDLSSLQVLAYGAALTLELLGLRARPLTPTLFLAGEAEQAQLPLWSEVADDEPPAAPDGEPVPAVAAPAFEAPEPALEPFEAEATLDVSPSGEWGLEPTREEPSTPEPGGLQFVEPESASAPATTASFELPPHEAGVEPAPWTAPEPVIEPAFEPTPGPAATTGAQSPAFAEPVAPVWEPAEDDTAVSQVTVAEAGESWSEPVFELAPEEEQLFELAPEEPVAVEPLFEAPAATPAPAIVEPAAPAAPASPFDRGVEEATAPLPTTSFPWSDSASTQRLPVAPPAAARADLSEDETVMIPRSGLPNANEIPSPFATGPTPAPTVSSLGGWPAAGDRTGGMRGAEVAPPADLQGPGWAFSTTRTPVSTGDDALHEEARRLARLLVSEIKLYNEEQVEEGRRRKDIYSRLKEDIDRSRQLFDERVHERVRATTDYFQQELVRNLAGGDPTALGR